MSGQPAQTPQDRPLHAVTDAPDGEYRVPPHDIAAEQAVLGGMMLAADVIDDVAGIVQASDFYRPAHQIIYRAIVGLWERNEPVDAVTVHGELARLGETGRTGEGPYLHTLISTVPTAANAAYYAEIVAGYGKLRSVIEASTRAAQRAYGASWDEAGDIVADAQSGLVVREAPGDDFQQIHQAMDEVLDWLDAGPDDTSQQIDVPYRDVNRLIGGMRPGQLFVLAGRPGVGKSVGATDIARHAAFRQGKTVALFSLEMSKADLVQRIISAEGSIGTEAIRNRTVSPDDRFRAAEIRDRVMATPNLLIDDREHISVNDMRARLRRMSRRPDIGAPDLVIVDYLQLVRGSSANPEHRQVVVAEISRSLKNLAKEFGIPVVALSQLNRGPEHRADKRPGMADLRESGQIEQDADVIMLMHRASIEPDEPDSGVMELIIPKNRHGATGTIKVAFQGWFSRMVDIAPDHLQDGPR